MPEQSNTELIHRSCPICEASCGLVYEVERSAKNVVKVYGDKKDPRSLGYMCPKALAPKGVYEDPDRIKQPMRRTGNSWDEIGWDEALDEMGDRLREIREKYGKDAVGSYIGNPTGHNFGAMIYTALFAQTMDSKRSFNAGSVDQFPKNISCSLMYGDPWMFPIPDIDRTDFFLIMGANPVISGGSLMSAPNMRARLKALRERGTKVVVIDPRRTETAALSDQHLFIKPGSDAYFLLAAINILFEEGYVNPGRLADFTDGIDEVKTLAQEFTPESVAGLTGITADKTRQLVREFSAAKRAVCYGRFGTCTQEFGSIASWLVDVFNILTGNFDRPGGLMFTRPATGQAEPVPEPGPPLSYGEAHSLVRGFPLIDNQMTSAVMAEEIDSAGEERMRALVTFVGNPVLTTPNSERFVKALEQLDFMVSIDMYLNETTRFAHIILPPTVHLEHENYDFLFSSTSIRNMVRYSPQIFEPPVGSRHHWELLLEVTARTNNTPWESMDDLMVEGMLATFVGKAGTPAEKVSLDDARKKIGQKRGPERLLDLMLRAGPYGDGFDDAAKGLSLENLRKTTHAIDLGPLESRLPDILRTPGRRIQIAPKLIVDDVKRLIAAREDRRKADSLILVTRRQMNNMNSWLHNLESLAKGKNRCTLEINPKDAKKAGVNDGGQARIRSRVGEIQVEVSVVDDMMPGVVSLPHGYGHNVPGTRLSVAKKLQPGANFNALTDELLLDELSGTVVVNGIPVEVQPA
jgi:anaerobic selenocysteine-containing dehydrogenase